MAAARLLLRLAGRLESVNFTQSVCDLLGAGQGPGPWHTHCSLERGQLVLSSHSFPGASERLPIQMPVKPLLQRPSFCPFAALDQQPGGSRTELPTNRGVDVGVAVILQSSDQTVLLTRRTCTLRISPNVWVPPGGHMELDEEILDCGLRELREECGLQMPQNQFSWVLLGLWESAYPPRLSWGFPKYHHLVVYVLVVSQESQQQLQARIQINPNEVSAFMWLGPDVAAAVATTEDSTETPRLLQDLPPSLCRGQGTGQRRNQVCSQALAATSGPLKVKVKFIWSPDQQKKDAGLRGGRCKGFCYKNCRPKFNTWNLLQGCGELLVHKVILQHARPRLCPHTQQ